METNSSEGWVPVDAAGLVWEYENSDGKGVLLIQRTAAGKRVYEATYRNAKIRDAAIATRRKSEALRFAMTGKDALQDALDDLEAEGITELVLRPFADDYVYRLTPKGRGELPPARLSPVRHAASPV